MSVKTGQAVTVLFSTANASTGAATDATGDPAGTLYVNGTADAASVTVTNITTGLYKAAVTLPALSAGDQVSIRIAATVATVAGEGVVWQETADTYRTSDIEALVDDLEGRVGSPSDLGSGASLAANLVDIEGETDDIGVAGAGLTALGDTRLANLDAAVSTRSTYAGADTAGTTTLLARLTALRAGYLDLLDTYLDAAVSTRSSHSAADVKTALEAAGSSLAQILADSAELQTDWHDGGRLDLILDAAGSVGDPWVTALPGAYGVGTAGYIMGLINAATAALPTDPADQSLLAAAIAAVALQITALGALAITVQSPVASTGTITIYQGDDYVTAEGTAITVTVAVAGCPSLTGATVRLKATEDTWTATSCTSDGTDWTIAFEPTAAETAALTVGAQLYELEATLATSHVRTLSTGSLIVRGNIPAI